MIAEEHCDASLKPAFENDRYGSPKHPAPKVLICEKRMHFIELAYRLAERQHRGMTWKPITEEAIWDKLNAAQDRMSVRQARLWDAIRIQPEKWGQEPWGQAGAGFWAVGLIGRIVIWFNDIEDGFNRSSYDRYGTIKEYGCNRDELEHAVQRALDNIDTGYEVGPFSPPPQPGEFDSM